MFILMTNNVNNRPMSVCNSKTRMWVRAASHAAARTQQHRNPQEEARTRTRRSYATKHPYSRICFDKEVGQTIYCA